MKIIIIEVLRKQKLKLSTVGITFVVDQMTK